jgi:hypothetical protein
MALNVKVDTTTVLEVLKRDDFWFRKTVTAGRVRNRIEAVLDRATASGYRSGPNPAAWSGRRTGLWRDKRCAMPLQPRHRTPPASAGTYISFFVLFLAFLVFFAAFLAADTSELPSATGWLTVACAFASTEDLVS